MDQGDGNQTRLRSARNKKKVTRDTGGQPVDWTGWRGPNRDGRVPWLPAVLAAKPKIVWEHKLASKGLGGVAATREHVFVSERELRETIDVFKCLDATNGKERWAVRFPCPGELDFGNSPRATPLVHEGNVCFFGAFGQLHAVEIATGKILWQIDVRDEFGADDIRKWGMCSSPLIADGKLIVNPGAKTASLVALDPKLGKAVWKTAGEPASYGSMIAGKFGGKLQIVGYDLTTMGGWDVATGKRLWTLTPDRANDFNVPTPVQYGDKLVVTTENNGTRIYGFNADGVIDSKPLAHNGDLAPDSHSPVVVGDRLFGIWHRLWCLDLKDGLKPIWEGKDDAFGVYGSLIASPDRLLATTLEGEILLIDAKGDEFKIISRCKIFEDERGVYSHPALCGKRFYLRGNTAVVRVDFD